jgi:hypothetical protein
VGDDYPVNYGLQQLPPAFIIQPVPGDAIQYGKQFVVLGPWCNRHLGQCLLYLSKLGHNAIPPNGITAWLYQSVQ